MVEVTCSGLLFDLDGVLIDSTPAVERVWSGWAIANGFDPVETVRRAHGRPSIETLRELLPNGDPEAENRKVERGEIEDTEGVVPLPGARELLDSLPENRWAIVTSCTRALAETRLRAAGLPIPQRLLTSNDITNGKPDPEPYRKGADLLGFPASKCLVFEDAPAGVRSGKAAGALVIALRTTSTDDQLEEAGADWILSAFADLSLIEYDNDSHLIKISLKV